MKTHHHLVSLACIVVCASAFWSMQIAAGKDDHTEQSGASNQNPTRNSTDSSAAVEEALADIASMKGRVRRKEHDGEIDLVDLSGRDVRGKLTSLHHLKTMEYLNLVNTKVAKDDLSNLHDLPILKRLWLNGSNIQNEDIKSLCKLTSLSWLDLSKTAITDDGLKHVGCLKNLTNLLLNGTQVKGSGLAHLSGLEALITLELSNTDIDDAGLRFIDLTSLLAVVLDGTRVTAAGLEHFKGSRLDSLVLPLTAVTEDSVKHLQTMPSLEALYLSGPDVTEKRLDVIRKALPNCRVKKSLQIKS